MFFTTSTYVLTFGSFGSNERISLIIVSMLMLKSEIIVTIPKFQLLYSDY